MKASRTRRVPPSWSRPSRSPGAHAWPSIAGPWAACSRHWRSCAPNSAGRASSATPPRPPARSRGRRRRPRARVPSQAPPLEVEEELFPRLRALAHAVDEPDKFLFAFGRGADDHQQALRGLLEPGLHMDAVDPEVKVAFGREIALAPTHMLVRPGLLEPPDGRGREPAGILAEQCDQRLLELTGGDALQAENRDRHL